jgi:hypothetical protein
MPEHYIDWWWEDLPEKQKKYARMLGYENQKHWDDDEAVPYDSKDFDECTYKELKAARYLGLDPIDQKLDIWWSEASEDTKKHAGVLGWDQEKWDDDWMIEDLPCEHLYWKDLSEEQKAAAKHFGYNKALWDETEDEEDDEEADEEVVSLGHIADYGILVVVSLTCLTNARFTFSRDYDTLLRLHHLLLRSH